MTAAIRRRRLQHSKPTRARTSIATAPAAIPAIAPVPRLFSCPIGGELLGFPLRAGEDDVDDEGRTLVTAGAVGEVEVVDDETEPSRAI